MDVPVLVMWHCRHGATSLASQTSASRWCVLSCMTPPVILPATSRTPPITLLLSMPRGDPPNVVLKRKAMTMRTVKPPTPSFDAMILLRKSALLRRMSCALLERPSSSASTSSWHSFTYTLANTLSLSYFGNSSR